MRIKLHWRILLGLVLGTLTGLVLLQVVGGAGGEPQGVAAQVLGMLRLGGTLFIRLLKMVIIPLIIATMISGVISLGSFRRLGQLGARTFLYYFATTALAVVTGLVLVNVIRPGTGADIGGGRLIEQYQAGLTTWSDMILSGKSFMTKSLISYGYDLQIVYLVWIAVVVALYPLCKKYNEYKMNNRSKWWLSYL